MDEIDAILMGFEQIIIFENNFKILFFFRRELVPKKVCSPVRWLSFAEDLTWNFWISDEEKLNFDWNFVKKKQFWHDCLLFGIQILKIFFGTFFFDMISKTGTPSVFHSSITFWRSMSMQ